MAGASWVSPQHENNGSKRVQDAHLVVFSFARRRLVANRRINGDGRASYENIASELEKKEESAIMMASVRMIDAE